MKARDADGPFDEAYYDRFYEDKRTRVQGPREVDRLVRGVLGFSKWLDEDIATVLDVGAGPGLWRDWFKRRRPAVDYVSMDVSRYACRRYGHKHGDIRKLPKKRRYDLVVCQGVIPYLSEPDAMLAIDNLGAVTKKFLYLECPTQRDLANACDVTRTDHALIPRRAEFYVERLRRHFHMLGMGVWLSRRVDYPLYELESGTLWCQQAMGWDRAKGAAP